MQTRRWVICAAAMAPLVLGPAVASAADKYANVHTVAIVSAIGEELALTKIGTMVFGNARSVLSISDWGIDAMVTRQIASALSPRFQIKNVSADTKALAKLEVPTLFSSGPSPEDVVRGLPADNGVDAYIVVSPFWTEDGYGGTNQKLGGLGLYHHETLGDAMDAMYAFYAINVYDARTGERLDYGTARIGESNWLGKMLPWKVTSGSDWAETPGAMTDAQKADVRAAMTSLIQESLVYALQNANLVAETPAGGASAAPAAPSP